MKYTRRFFAAAGGLLITLYIFTARLFPLPDFVMGFIMGMSIVFLLLSLLPERVLEKLKTCKCRG